MASFPAKLFLTRALCQLRCLHLPVRYNTNHLQSMVGNTQPLARLLGSRWVHCTTFALAKKTVTEPAMKKDPVSAARERRAQTVRVIGEEDADEQLMTKAQAESLAKQRMLKLVLLENDTEGTHPTYQLMTGKQLAEERNRLQELKKLHKKKEAKALRVTSRISKHDLETKTKKVVEWLQKGQEVKLTIKNRTPDNDKVRKQFSKFPYFYKFWSESY